MTGEVLNRPWMRAVALAGAVATSAYLVASRNAVVTRRNEDEDRE